MLTVLVRLWSLEMKSDLVAYKGHNYPVWDVEFSPLGYYFATASHDRTARIWRYATYKQRFRVLICSVSTDHIFPLRILAGHLSDVEVRVLRGRVVSILTLYSVSSSIPTAIT